MSTATAGTELRTEPSASLCEECEHREAAHDILGRRHCRATLAGALARDCICSPHKT